jgi:hypothetical protein
VFASHTAYRGLLRPSSLQESSHPPLRVFSFKRILKIKKVNTESSEVGVFNKNDPSAGSPTDTVLRLLHPLDDKAHDTSLRRAMQGTCDCSGPCNLPDHPIG